MGRLVSPRPLDGADERVRRVVPEGEVTLTGTAEVSVHGLAHEGGKRHAAPPRPIPQLPVGFFGEP
jgi:hypothetical protein